MKVWNEYLLSAYYLMTLPARWQLERGRAARHAVPLRILFYHRVADEHPNDWTISTRIFARQIRWLRRRFEIVSLCEAQRRIASGRNDRPTACITFDDGYADNMRFALPLLAKYSIPCTYFVSTDFVQSGRPFPHDVAAGQPLVPNTPNQLRRLAAAGVEIGGHTRSHVDLGAPGITQETLSDEIAEGKLELERMIGREVRYFAFPYGQQSHLSAEAFRVAAQAGYAGVCSAYGGYNFPGDDPFHLRRFHADPQMVRFKNWLTVDPRKLRTQQEFDISFTNSEAERDFGRLAACQLSK
jgi:peptidoglycan/xylan/chitin deacetylase (PgdA/CDA1 family)